MSGGPPNKATTSSTGSEASPFGNVAGELGRGAGEMPRSSRPQKGAAHENTGAVAGASRRGRWDGWVGTGGGFKA